MGIMDSLLGSMDSLLEWMSTALHQTATSYCELETADSEDTLVARDGSLVSIVRLDGARFLVGSEEFDRLHEAVRQTLQTALARKGHTLQVCFVYDKDAVKRDITDIFSGARGTAKRLNLELSDLFDERVSFLSRYCAKESCYLALWTRPDTLAKKQQEQAKRNKIAKIKKNKLPPMRYAQSIVAAIPELRDTHRSFVRSTFNDLNYAGLDCEILNVHDAIRCVRETIDAEFTDQFWRPVLPGDKIPVRFNKKQTQDVSEVMWPSLARQLFPRDGENLDLHHARIGNRIYASVFIDLFPQEVKRFSVLFNRVVSANLPWRISYLVDSDGLSGIRFKSLITSILSFASTDNVLMSDSKKILSYIETNTDDPVVKLRVALSTWAPSGEMALLKQRHAELAKAVQGWGYCEVSELSGDPFGGALSSSLALNANNFANPSVAPFSDVSYMFPFTRPSSSWQQGALLFRSPDGKPWPYQPGSSRQTTWIDLIYARPGSGKSVLSNAINLGLCLNPGNQRLPRISIIDIGPSSSGLISLIREALPPDKRYLAAYHRLRMTPEFSINPFDTQLGARYPTPLERSFLVNFMALLGTPLGSSRPYDGIVDMAGMVIDEMYKQASDTGTPNLYASSIEPAIDVILDQKGFKFDAHTSWWEVTDFLFENGYIHEAMLAQRHAVPLVADAASVCRLPAVEDLFGNVTAPTGETLIQAFGRMISSAVREYPILGRVTQFDIGDARIVSLDLDEVAKTGGEAADRQTAIMYMIARYVLARDYYLTPENVADLPKKFRDYHRARIIEIREDAKRIVFDEFHRTANAAAVRNQVIVDMREGRKWKVQVALLSQSLDDFDPVMVDFATSVFIMDAGPKQAIEKSATVFGLSETAKTALRTRVHGPREGGGTFLAQFSTKDGVNTQLLTNTIGPIELWAFSTTAEDTRVRNELYTRLGPRIARRVLAALYPTGTIAPVVEKRLAEMQEEGAVLEESGTSIIQGLIEEIITEYRTNPAFGAVSKEAVEEK